MLTCLLSRVEKHGIGIRGTTSSYKKGQRTALFLRLRSFSILRIFFSFFSCFFFPPIILYHVLFSTALDELWYDHFFLLLFPIRFISFIVLTNPPHSPTPHPPPKESLSKRTLFSVPSFLRCFAAETLRNLFFYSWQIVKKEKKEKKGKKIEKKKKRNSWILHVQVSDSWRWKIEKFKYQWKNVAIISKEGRDYRVNWKQKRRENYKSIYKKKKISTHYNMRYFLYITYYFSKYGKKEKKRKKIREKKSLTISFPFPQSLPATRLLLHYDYL